VSPALSHGGEELTKVGEEKSHWERTTRPREKTSPLRLCTKGSGPSPEDFRGKEDKKKKQRVSRFIELKKVNGACLHGPAGKIKRVTLGTVRYGGGVKWGRRRRNKEA